MKSEVSPDPPAAPACGAGWQAGDRHSSSQGRVRAAFPRARRSANRAELLAVAQRPGEFRIEVKVEVRLLRREDFRRTKSVVSHQPVRLIEAVFPHQWGATGGRIEDAVSARMASFPETSALFTWTAFRNHSSARKSCHRPRRVAAFHAPGTPIRGPHPHDVRSDLHNPPSGKGSPCAGVRRFPRPPAREQPTHRPRE